MTERSIIEDKIRIKKMNPNAIIPKIAHVDDAGADLYACIEDSVTIPPHCTTMIGTGIAIETPVGYFAGVFPRSGIASKRGLRAANCVGVIDATYRGEIMVALHNDSSVEQIILPNERIAQLIIIPCVHIDFEEVKNLSDTERGEGGFGSIGTN